MHAVQMTQNLEGLGFTVVPFGQGYKDMSPPTKELMKLTLEQELAHGGHPVLRWIGRYAMKAATALCMMGEVD
jgi:phage terminase large subunit-like protein